MQILMSEGAEGTFILRHAEALGSLLLVEAERRVDMPGREDI